MIHKTFSPMVTLKVISALEH